MVNELAQSFDVKLVTFNPDVKSKYTDSQFLLLPEKKSRSFTLLKLLFVFSNISKSITDSEFPKRNLYRKNKTLLNMLFYAKLLFSRLSLLPSHSTIVKSLFAKKTDYDVVLSQFDIVIFNSLVIHNGVEALPLIARAIARPDIVAIADVYSWDNVFYSSIIKNADLYWVWNDKVRLQLNDIHAVPLEKIKVSGPQIFEYLKGSDKVSLEQSGQRYILYAAAFCDNVLSVAEVNLIIQLAKILYEIDPSVTMVFRPYPSLQGSIYHPLMAIPNIEIREYGAKVKRYHDQDEVIRLENSFDEKIHLMKNATAFISMGSTFTLEQSYFDVPIVQLNFFDKSLGAEVYSIFERIHISDHLLLNLLDESSVYTVRNFSEFRQLFISILKQPSDHLQYSHKLRGFADPFPAASSFRPRLTELANEALR